ncbi:MAG TPA: response regulator [Stellaceae bacterium]|nr:response regulator [Stellaceae bacterium]
MLLVEDNVGVGEFAQQLLLELGYAVVRVESAAAALAVIRSNRKIDIVFSDIVMPGMTGIALAEEVRRSHPHLPFVLTTGYSEDIAKSDTGGLPILFKPYRLDTLAAVIRKALANNGATGEKA